MFYLAVLPPSPATGQTKQQRCCMGRNSSSPRWGRIQTKTKQKERENKQKGGGATDFKPGASRVYRSKIGAAYLWPGWCSVCSRRAKGRSVTLAPLLPKRHREKSPAQRGRGGPADTPEDSSAQPTGEMLTAHADLPSLRAFPWRYRSCSSQNVPCWYHYSQEDSAGAHSPTQQRTAFLSHLALEEIKGTAQDMRHRPSSG